MLLDDERDLSACSASGRARRRRRGRTPQGLVEVRGANRHGPLSSCRAGSRPLTLAAAEPRGSLARGNSRFPVALFPNRRRRRTFVCRVRHVGRGGDRASAAVARLGGTHRLPARANAAGGPRRTTRRMSVAQLPRRLRLPTGAVLELVLARRRPRDRQMAVVPTGRAGRASPTCHKGTSPLRPQDGPARAGEEAGLDEQRQRTRSRRPARRRSARPRGACA